MTDATKDCMTELIFLRHTQVKVDKGICYGQADVPLADTYSNELRVIKEQLTTLTIAATYTSPLTRCYQLAGDLESIVKQQPIQIPEFMELDFGHWELKNWDQNDDPLLSTWYDNYLIQPATGGESWADLCVRVQTMCQYLISKHLGETILIVTHAGVIRAAQVLFQGVNPKAAFAQQIPYGSLQHIHIDQTGTTKRKQDPILKSIND